jgi:hypothetical protein
LVSVLQLAPFAHCAKHEHGYYCHAECGAYGTNEQADARRYRAGAAALNIDKRVADEAAGKAGQEDADEGDSARER